MDLSEGNAGFNSTNRARRGHLPFFNRFLTTQWFAARYARDIMQRDFVLQLRASSNPERRDLSGRIEHLDSGRAASFQNLEELAAAIARLLAAAESGPPKS